jgi:hypothetical protein
VRIRTGIALTAMAVATSLPTAALAASERMHLNCEETEVGRIERTNGASWWDEAGNTYTTTHLRVTRTEDGQVVYEKAYGNQRPQQTLTCTAEHFDFTWEVELVRAGRR